MESALAFCVAFWQLIRARHAYSDIKVTTVILPLEAPLRRAVN